MEIINFSKRSDMNLQKTAYIKGLDGLRMLAIAGVTLFHLLPQTFCGGYIGVSLFFVLTGYLLAYTSEYRRMQGTFHLISYGIKRVKRIYPSLVLVILITIGVYSFLLPQVVEAIRGEVFSVLLGYNNWWQIAQNADYFTRLANQSPFTHLWFLGIEIQYYLLWPIIFFLYIGISQIYGIKKGVACFTFCGLLASLYMVMLYQSGESITRLYYGTDTRIYAFLLGAAIGLYQAHFFIGIPYGKGSVILKFGIFLVTLGCTIISYLGMDGQSSFTYQGGMFLMTLNFCVMLMLTTDPDLRIGELFERAVPRWIGKKSYGIFLWQYPVIFLFQKIQWNEVDVWNRIGIPADVVSLVPAIEIILIILCTLWTDIILDGLHVLRRISSLHRRLVTHALLVFLLTAPGVVLMGYGCKGIVESTSDKQYAVKLKEQMQKNEEALQQQDSRTQHTTALDNMDLHDIACIGDSVMLGSAMEIKKVLPDCYIDAKTSRYVGAGLEIAKTMEASQRLGNIVLIALGTNGPLDGQYEEQTQALLHYLGPNRKIFWVNVYCPSTGWQDSNNTYLEKIKKQYPNVTVIDWYSLASKHPEWLVEDGIHPNDEGTKQYAELIHQSMVQALQKK